jgi:hypothetical protein
MGCKGFAKLSDHTLNARRLSERVIVPAALTTRVLDVLAAFHATHLIICCFSSKGRGVTFRYKGMAASASHPMHDGRTVNVRGDDGADGPDKQSSCTMPVVDKKLDQQLCVRGDRARAGWSASLRQWRADPSDARYQ